SYYEDVEPIAGLARTKEAERLNNRFQAALSIFSVHDADCDLAGHISVPDPAPDPKTSLNAAVANFLRAGTLAKDSPRSAVCADKVMSSSLVTSSAALGKRRIEDVRDAFCGVARDLCPPESVSSAYLTLAKPSAQLASQISAKVFAKEPNLAKRLEERLREL